MKPYNRISLSYLIIGVVWIVATDSLVATLATDSATHTFLQTAKGWVFVLLSTLLIHQLTRRAFQKTLRNEQEKRAIFRKTMEGSHHILLNYLNQMQLVTLEARRCPDFDPEILELAQEISDEAVRELRKLEELKVDEPEDIESFIYRKSKKSGRAAGPAGRTDPTPPPAP